MLQQRTQHGIQNGHTEHLLWDQRRNLSPLPVHQSMLWARKKMMHCFPKKIKPLLNLGRSIKITTSPVFFPSDPLLFLLFNYPSLLPPPLSSLPFLSPSPLHLLSPSLLPLQPPPLPLSLSPSLPPLLPLLFTPSSPLS